MIRALCTVLALLAATPSAAEMFASVGAGVTDRDLSDDPPFDQLNLDYDSGTALIVELGGRFASGLMLRGNYKNTKYDEFTALGTLLIDKNITQRDMRAGAFFAPVSQGVLGYRLGAGYARIDESGQYGSGARDGSFAEAAALVHAGRRITFDLAAARINVSGMTSTEFRLASILHAGAIDVALNGLYADLEYRDFFFPLTEQLTTITLSVGGSWDKR